MSLNLNDAAMAGNVEEVIIRLNLGEDVNQKYYPRYDHLNQKYYPRYDHLNQKYYTPGMMTSPTSLFMISVTTFF